jgi:hypothetical protein
MNASPLGEKVAIPHFYSQCKNSGEWTIPMERLEHPVSRIGLSVEERDKHFFSLEQLLTAVRRLNLPHSRRHPRTGVPKGFSLSHRNNAVQSQGEDDGIKGGMVSGIDCM